MVDQAESSELSEQTEEAELKRGEGTTGIGILMSVDTQASTVGLKHTCANAWAGVIRVAGL